MTTRTLLRGALVGGGVVQMGLAAVCWAVGAPTSALFGVCSGVICVVLGYEG